MYVWGVGVRCALFRLFMSMARRGRAVPLQGRILSRRCRRPGAGALVEGFRAPQRGGAVRRVTCRVAPTPDGRAHPCSALTCPWRGSPAGWWRRPTASGDPPSARQDSVAPRGGSGVSLHIGCRRGALLSSSLRARATRLAGCQLDNPTWRYLTSRLRFSCICRFPLGFQSHLEGRRTLRSRAQCGGFVSRMLPGACAQVRRAHPEALTEASGGVRSSSVDAALKARSGRSVTSDARERRSGARVD